MKRFILAAALTAAASIGFAGCVVHDHDDHRYHDHGHDRPVIIEDHHDDHRY